MAAHRERVIKPECIIIERDKSSSAHKHHTKDDSEGNDGKKTRQTHFSYSGIVNIM